MSEILEEYEGLTQDNIRACLLFFRKVAGKHEFHAAGGGGINAFPC